MNRIRLKIQEGKDFLIYYIDCKETGDNPKLVIEHITNLLTNGAKNLSFKDEDVDVFIGEEKLKNSILEFKVID